MNMNRVLVYFTKDSLAPKGGPAAVCFYYYKEQCARGETIFEFLPATRNGSPSPNKHNVLINIWEQFHTLGAVIKMLYFKPHQVPYDLNSYDLIHFHSTDSLYKARTSLDLFKGRVILQSHSPEPRGREMFTALPSWIKVLFPFFKKRFEKMDKFAFERADYIIFPCAEAEEPYYHTWPYFKFFHDIKPNAFKYVLTGIPEAQAKRGRDDVLAEMHIKSDAFVISYVGRHNYIKGYDILKEIGKQYLDIDEDSWVLCAGKETPLKGLEHPRWKEVGWTTDPHSYIGASDVFVLPNRETYFDIIMMELLSLGKIVIASNTGGNKWFVKHNCPGVFLYDTIEDAVSLIKKVKSLSSEEKERLEAGNRAFYSEFLTVKSMYDSYIQLLNNLLGQ
jgi:glycosyltransferase involved in cell wall biosynthesis